MIIATIFAIVGCGTICYGLLMIMEEWNYKPNSKNHRRKATEM